MLRVGPDVVAALEQTEDALVGDQRFEYMNDVERTLKEFIARAWAERSVNHVPSFIELHARPLLQLTCFIPIENLKVQSTVHVLGVDLLVLDDPAIPRPEHAAFALTSPIGCVAAIPTSGTNVGMMADRARGQLSVVLRIARAGLATRGLRDRQLRFRPGTAYAFSNDAIGWTRRSDSAYELTVTPPLIDNQAAVWKLPVDPVTDVEKKAMLALHWMERARFTGEPLIALLYLFFALEALLGDKKDGLKGGKLSRRQLILSHAVTGGFRHPDTTWLLYDQVRSAAVHGEAAPPIDEDTVQRLEWSVRDTLDEYLTFTATNGIKRRSALIQALDEHPDVPELANWVRDNAAVDWET